MKKKTEYDKLIGTYSARLTPTGNVVLKSQSTKLTLKPEVLREFILWLHNSVPGEDWVHDELQVEMRKDHSWMDYE